jgi:acyl-CoA synthetase (AMP-forming)/AMP-acid ligase II
VAAKVVDPGDWTRVLETGERGELAVSGYHVMKGYWGDKRKTDEVLVSDEDGVIWMHVSLPTFPLSLILPSSFPFHADSKLPHQTGDEAAIDAQGYVRITGRIKDLIIKGGENIHPLEIENCLLSHPSISEVSVVGLPNERYGEVVAAFVVAREGVRIQDSTAPALSPGSENISGPGPENTAENGEEKGKGSVITTEDVRSWVLKNLSHHLVPKYVFWVSEYPKTASGKIQKFKLREMGLEFVREGKGV